MRTDISVRYSSRNPQKTFYAVSFAEEAGKDVFDRHAAGVDIPVKPLPPVTEPS